MNYLTFIKKKYRKIIIWLLFIIPGVPFILISFGFAIYAYWPRDFTQTSSLNIKSDVEYIAISAHGVHDSPKSWSDELQKAIVETTYPQLHNVKIQSISLNWEKFSSDVFICSVAGRKIGYQIGKKIAQHKNIKGIHAIGHSCGAFVVLGICEAVKTSNKKILVQTTYLDPVSIYAGIQWNYGITHFGSCADFSDTYIDTDDSVPGSNQILPFSATTDVTSLKLKKEIPPHAWPTRYYVDAYKSQKVPLFYNKSTKMN